MSMASAKIPLSQAAEVALAMASTNESESSSTISLRQDHTSGVELPFQVLTSNPDLHVVGGPGPVVAAPASTPAGTMGMTLSSMGETNCLTEHAVRPDCRIDNMDRHFPVHSLSAPDPTMAEMVDTEAAADIDTKESTDETRAPSEGFMDSGWESAVGAQNLPLDFIFELEPASAPQEMLTQSLADTYEAMMILGRKKDAVALSEVAQHLESAFREMDLQLPSASSSDVGLFASTLPAVRSGPDDAMMQDDAGSPPEGANSDLRSPEVDPDVPEDGPAETEDHVTALRRATIAAVDWDFVRFAAALFHGSERSPRLGRVGYAEHSIVRALLFEDDVIWVARIPLLRSLERPVSEDDLALLSRQVSNGVATLRYVAAHTEIPVPALHYWTSSQDGGGAGLPFRLESVPLGAPLSGLWDDMTADHRSVVLEQIATIYLELSYNCRLPKIGSLYMRARSAICEALNGEVNDPGPILFPPSLDISSFPDRQSLGGPYTYGLDYLDDDAHACLDLIRLSHFGSAQNASRYVGCWLLRSLLPYVYHYGHAMADSKGFALFPGNFGLDNLWVDRVEGAGGGGWKLTAVRDWDFSSTLPNSSFSQFPPFLQEDPLLPPPSPGREARLTSSQITLLEHLRSQEITRDIWIPLTSHMDLSHLSHAVCAALHNPELGADYAVWDEVHVGRPQRFDMYWEAVEGLERGVLREVLGEFGRDREVRERVVSLLDPDGTVEIPEESAHELLERIREVRELEEERTYLEELLAR
ncbi:hypothetical protein CALCODRAFT_279221 [Calocera cornea HHB12733]|uniref:Aminoglycoside phosphotransferase domain-containing protein n=1 Tax=Calocera cornea HHB12733 TaxID=1353952 RepID=A0A165JRU8_9BASI|nr:hypothetical protein CALCODRAFT_279221 [Calocera cornea HHB12733]